MPSPAVLVVAYVRGRTGPLVPGRPQPWGVRETV
jgi:hypothetical protein